MSCKGFARNILCPNSRGVYKVRISGLGTRDLNPRAPENNAGVLTIGPRHSSLASVVFCSSTVSCDGRHCYDVLSYLSFPQIVEGRRRKGLLILPRRRRLMAEPTDAQHVTRLSEIAQVRRRSRLRIGASLICCWSCHGPSWLRQNLSQAVKYIIEYKNSHV
jgi:hypothetical protein